MVKRIYIVHYSYNEKIFIFTDINISAYPRLNALTCSMISSSWSLMPVSFVLRFIPSFKTVFRTCGKLITNIAVSIGLYLSCSLCVVKFLQYTLEFFWWIIDSDNIVTKFQVICSYSRNRDSHISHHISNTSARVYLNTFGEKVSPCISLCRWDGKLIGFLCYFYSFFQTLKLLLHFPRPQVFFHILNTSSTEFFSC